jgi:hypothetical protein
MQSDICTSCASNGLRRVFLAAKVDNDKERRVSLIFSFFSGLCGGFGILQWVL